MRGGLCLHPRLWTGIQHKFTSRVAGKIGALTSDVTWMISMGVGGTGGGVKVSLHLPGSFKVISSGSPCSAVSGSWFLSVADLPSQTCPSRSSLWGLQMKMWRCKIGTQECGYDQRCDQNSQDSRWWWAECCSHPVSTVTPSWEGRWENMNLQDFCQRMSLLV